MLGQCSQAEGGIVGVPMQGQELDVVGSLPTL